MTNASEHLTIEIQRRVEDIYEFVKDPRNLHLWAQGLAGSPLTLESGKWVADSPMGQVTVRFADDNPFGVLDHEVGLPDGSTALNPVRVIPLTEDSSELVFTARRRGMPDNEFDNDQDLINADLKRLKELLEA